MTSSPYDPFTAPPPGTGSGYPAAGPPDRWRPNTALATALAVLFALLALSLVLNTVGLVRRSLVLSDSANLTGLSSAELDSIDLWVNAPVVVYLILVLFTAPTFIVWQYRHAKNARLLGQTEGLGPGWAIGGWFIPMANCVLPAVQLRGANRWSHPAGSRPGSASALIIPWLACLAIGNTVVRVAAMGEPAESEGLGAYLDWIVTSDQIEAAGTVLMIAAAVLALCMVRTLTQQQEQQRPVAATPWSSPGSPWQGAPTGYGQPPAYPWGPPPAQQQGHQQQGHPWPAPPSDQTPPPPLPR